MKQKNTTISDTQSKKIAIRLKKLREEKGISHETLSEKLEYEISKDSLIKYEKADKYNSSFGANKGMSIDNAVKLANFYNVSVDYLLCKTDIRTPNTELKYICDYTGLSENAVNTFLQWNTTMCNTASQIIESREFFDIVYIIIQAQNNKDLLSPNDIPIINGISEKLSNRKRSENEIVSDRLSSLVAQRGLAPYYKKEVSDDITALFDKLTENGEK